MAKKRMAKKNRRSTARRSAPRRKRTGVGLTPMEPADEGAEIERAGAYGLRSDAVF